jgi:hypothetical protein
MVIELTILLAAATAPTIAAIGAGRVARKAAERAAETLGDTAQAPTTAATEIEELKQLVRDLRATHAK